MRAANQCLLLFTSQLPPSLHSELVSTGNGKEEARIYPALPLLNFLSLLLLAAQRGTGGKSVFAQLKLKYRAYLQDQIEGMWDDALEQIGEMCFGIQKPRQSNPLMDMMGMFGGAFGGGGGGGSGPGSASRRVGGSPAPPVMGLD